MFIEMQGSDAQINKLAKGNSSIRIGCTMRKTNNISFHVNCIKWQKSLGHIIISLKIFIWMAQQKKYAKITLETRQKLLDLVLKENYTFKKAADYLKINQSTARMIVRKYERDGCLFEKKEDHARRVQIQKALREYKEKQEKQQKETQPTFPTLNPYKDLWLIPALSNLLMNFSAQKQQP